MSSIKFRRVGTLIAVPLITALVGCGGGEPPGRSDAMRTVAKCLNQQGAQVTRQRDELSGGYREVVALSRDQGLLKIYLVDDARKSDGLKQAVERELSRAAVDSGLGLAYVDIRQAGHVITAVTAPPGDPSRGFSERDLPTQGDEAAVMRCSARAR